MADLPRLPLSDDSCDFLSQPVMMPDHPLLHSGPARPLVFAGPHGLLPVVPVVVQRNLPPQRVHPLTDPGNAHTHVADRHRDLLKARGVLPFEVGR